MDRHRSPRQHTNTEGARGGPLIDMRAVTKTYATPSGPFTAITGVSLHVWPGEFVAVVGKSGSGKTTLLNLLAGIDQPTSGAVAIGGTLLHVLSESERAEWRGGTVGLVFQFFQLLPTLTVLENVMLPMDFAQKIPLHQRRPRALALLDRVGIQEQAARLPATLSGGQQQRAAIARALANDPPILLADEPTGNLDSATSATVLELFAGLQTDGHTIVMVTHEREISQYASRQVTLIDGRVGGGGQVQVERQEATEVAP